MAFVRRDPVYFHAGAQFHAVADGQRAVMVSVITPIDYDHLEMLGPELGKIAWEKAGIIKAGAPAVVARQRDEALAVIEAEADLVGAPLSLMGRDFDAFEQRGRLVVQTERQLLDLPPPSLFGAHQFANAGLAIAALLALEDPRIDEAQIARGVSGAVWPGRFQRLTMGPIAEIARDAGADLVVLCDGSALHARAVWRNTPVGDAIGSASNLVAIGSHLTTRSSGGISRRGAAPRDR